MLKFLGKRKSEKTERAAEKTRRAWFSHVTDLFRSGKLDDDLWEELEELLIAADVGLGPAQDLLERLRRRVREEGISDPEGAIELLKQELVSVLDVQTTPATGNGKTPHTVLMVGVNGAGKTTSIAKLAQLYADDGKQVLLGAADTFRAAAIEQLQVWGSRVGADVIAHRQGADPGAVAFDTLQAARSRDIDVVIIDTAGRLHSKANLMEEMKKVRRVLSRHDDRASVEVILAMDATTGQNGLAQARAFTEAIRCDGVFLSKLDGTAKGGVIVAIAAELKLPVLYIGTGEQLEDIAPFDPREFIDALFASPDAA